jgi:hypothetical protein
VESARVLSRRLAWREPWPPRDPKGRHENSSFPMSDNTEDKVVVITGASSGLGKATARHLAGCGVRRPERLQALATELGPGPDGAAQTDVTDPEQVARLFDKAAMAAEPLTCVIEPIVAARMKELHENFAIPAKSFPRAIALPMGQPREVGTNEIPFWPSAQDL